MQTGLGSWRENYMCTENLGTGVPQRQYESNGEKEIQKPTLFTTLDLIQTKLKDPNFDAYDVMRLVTYVIATLAMRILRLGFTAEESYIRHHLAKCVAPLRALGRSIIDTDKLRGRADVIFWDGEKIKLVSDTMVGWFIEAMRQAGLGEFERGMVLRNYRDLATQNEPKLRRETGG